MSGSTIYNATGYYVKEIGRKWGVFTSKDKLLLKYKTFETAIKHMNFLNAQKEVTP